MRISGLSSGMDTEQIINELMNAERIPVDRVFQQKVRAEWKRDAYRDVNTKLLRLKNLSLDMRLQSTYQKNTALSSNENILSVTATGSAQTGSYEFQVTQLATSSRIVAEDVDQRLAAFFAGENAPTEAIFKLKGINGEMEEITVSKEDTLGSVLTKINENKNLGINAFHDSGNVSLTTKGTGAESQFVVEDDAGFFAEVFGVTLENGFVTAGVGETAVTTGQNAVVNVNGINIERSSNSFELNGVNFNLHEVSDTVVRVDVRQDTDAIVDKIKEYVGLYNELVDEFNLSTREKVYRDFPPLTDAQREVMSDKEIELWEEKAKSGVLRGDAILGSILTEMRMALGGTVEGLEGNKNLAQIGIKTGSWYEYGHLHIDEDKLRAAVEEDAGAVRDIFTKSSDVNNEKGLARRLTDVLDKGIKRLTDTAGNASSSYDQSYLGEQIRNFETRLFAMEERLIRVEQNHWNKFTAMERVLSQLNAQSDWLYQQLMTMQG